MIHFLHSWCNASLSHLWSITCCISAVMHCIWALAYCNICDDASHFVLCHHEKCHTYSLTCMQGITSDMFIVLYVVQVLLLTVSYSFHSVRHLTSLTVMPQWYLLHATFLVIHHFYNYAINIDYQSLCLAPKMRQGWDKGDIVGLSSWRYKSAKFVSK